MHQENWGSSRERTPGRSSRDGAANFLNRASGDRSFLTRRVLVRERGNQQTAGFSSERIVVRQAAMLYIVFQRQKRVALKQESGDGLVRSWSNGKPYIDDGLCGFRGICGDRAAARQPS